MKTDSAIRRNSRKRGMNVNTVYINGKQVGQCTYAQIRPTSGSKSVPENYDIELIEFVSVQPQLNENQQIVFEWLKGNYVQGYGAAVIRTIHLLQKENTVDISDSSYVRGAYRDLNTVEEAVVVKMFADWALEQEEEKC